jgi:exosortase/archaeosortase family protein
MKTFIMRYFFYLALLFTLLYAPTSELSIWLNTLQREFTLQGLNLFLKPEQLKGIDIWINPHYKIIITQACNGFIPILLLWASILAFKGEVWKKLLWGVGGYLLFSVVNVARILFVVYATEQEGGAANFYWSHDLLGNFFLMATGLLLFIGYVKHASSSTPSPQQ